MPKESKAQSEANAKERASWNEWRHESRPSTKQQQRTWERANGRSR